ncbi:MAG: hypothetical protein V4591_03605 [Bdellovibrionota bacterium]
MKKKLIALCAASVGTMLLTSGCSTPKNYALPSQDQYQGYKIIDGVDKNVLFAKINTEDKIAVVLRDIGTTSYSFIEPRYNNSMVHFDGKSQCCGPDSPIMGNSGLVVYNFSFIGKGTTAINIISRQKGLSPTAASFETDHVYVINAEVK